MTPLVELMLVLLLLENAKFVLTVVGLSNALSGMIRMLRLYSFTYA